MSELIKAKEPFKFYARSHLTELTGLRATTLGQLCGLIKTILDACVYHHTHRFLQQHQYLSPEPPNDFAYWVTSVLGERELGEQLSSVNIIEYTTISSLRERFIKIIDDYLSSNPLAKMRFSREGEEFHFMKSVSFILPTGYVVYDLKEFSQALSQITIDSIYFHMFEARLRLGKGTNDFSNWLDTSLGDKELAESIADLDPYTYTLEELRKTVIKIVDMRLFG